MLTSLSVLFRERVHDDPIMDELGLKSDAERAHFLDNTLRVQQAFDFHRDHALGLSQRDTVDL